MPIVKKAPANLRPPRPHSTRTVAAIEPGTPQAAWYVYDEKVALTDVAPRSAPYWQGQDQYRGFPESPSRDATNLGLEETSEERVVERVGETEAAKDGDDETTGESETTSGEETLDVVGVEVRERTLRQLPARVGVRLLRAVDTLALVTLSGLDTVQGERSAEDTEKGPRSGAYSCSTVRVDWRLFFLATA